MLTIKACIKIKSEETLDIFLLHAPYFEALFCDDFLDSVGHLEYLFGFFGFASCHKQELSSSSHLNLNLIQELNILLQQLLD